MKLPYPSLTSFQVNVQNMVRLINQTGNQGTAK